MLLAPVHPPIPVSHAIDCSCFLPPASDGAPRGLPLRPDGYGPPAPRGVQARMGMDRHGRPRGPPARSHGAVDPELAQHLLLPRLPGGARGRRQRVRASTSLMVCVLSWAHHRVLLHVIYQNLGHGDDPAAPGRLRGAAGLRRDPRAGRS